MLGQIDASAVVPVDCQIEDEKLSWRLRAASNVHYGNTLLLLTNHGKDGARSEHGARTAVYPLLSQPGSDLAAREPGVVQLAR
jgi:hypothetical protein